MATYPWVVPRHGGQHRMYNIQRMLIGAGHDVQSVGVLGSPHYDKTEGFIRYPGDSVLAQVLNEPAIMEDWAIGKLLADNVEYFYSLFSTVLAPPDAILIGHPWLFECAQKFANQCEVKPNLFYDAHNIESSLKYGIVRPRLGEETARDYEAKVLKTEIAAIQGADLISCVSSKDKAWLTKYASSPVVEARNGVADRTASLKSIQASNSITGACKFALYCGSAHPPNIDGFFEIFGEGVGSFAPGQKLVVAGGAGFHIRNSPRFEKTAGLNSIYIDAGEVDEDSLSGLLKTAHAVILPITHGGGTNLKTAEAIWASKHIVATPTALRGFENFTTMNGIHIADEGPTFRKALRDVMGFPALHTDAIEKNGRQSVLWDNTLVDLVQMIGTFGKKES